MIFGYISLSCDCGTFLFVFGESTELDMVIGSVIVTVLDLADQTNVIIASSSATTSADIAAGPSTEPPAGTGAVATTSANITANPSPTSTEVVQPDKHKRRRNMQAQAWNLFEEFIEFIQS